MNKRIKLRKTLKRFIVEIEDETYNACKECHKRRKPSKENQNCIICYQAKLLYNPSGNEIMDEFIKYTQINFIQEFSRMKFISYNQFKNIEYIKSGGFSKIYKATWINGPPYWNKEKEAFEYDDPNMIVALKQLNNSKNITFDQLKEVNILFISTIIFYNLILKKLIFIFIKFSF